jgi:transposase
LQRFNDQERKAAMAQYVGLDVSMEETSVCVLDENGSTVWEGKVVSEPEAITRALHRHAPDALKVGLETGPTSTWLWHELRAARVPAICLDARHAQAALSVRLNKTDRNDAAGLAQLVRMGWYREVQVKQLAAHGDTALLASRALLVRQRCELENQIRGLLKNVGLRSRATKGRAFEQSVRALAARNAMLQGVIAPLLAAWSAMCLQIAVLSRSVQQRTRGDAVCQRLMTMPGVGPITALAFKAVVDDPARFKHSASVGAYLGLTPRRYSSGEIDRMGRISRCGDPMARSYLFEAANIMLARSRSMNPLKSWGTRLANRAGFKKARVALARKMAVVLHRMWADGTDFGEQKAVA